MRVLLSNHQLTEVGGTEVWVLTMAEALKRHGHDVSVYTFLQGEVADRVARYATVTSQPPRGSFDVCLLNHNTCLAMLSGVDGPKVFTSHGPMHRLEIATGGADFYVAVSEEVQGVMALNGIVSTVIRNPVNLAHIRTSEGSGESMPRALVMCKNIDAVHMAQKACTSAGFSHVVAHRDVHWWPDVTRIIPNFDVVITSGRGVYEAMACDRPVIIFDRRSGMIQADGWVSETNIQRLVQYNCSGRCFKYRWGVWELANALREYKPYAWGREWVEEHHDVNKIVAQYLEVA